MRDEFQLLAVFAVWPERCASGGSAGFSPLQLALGGSKVRAKPFTGWPVFGDTLHLDPRSVEAAITPKTRAIVPVHMAGQPADMDDIARAFEKVHEQRDALGKAQL